MPRKLFAAALTFFLAIVFFRMIAPFLISLALGALFSHMLRPVFVRFRRVLGNDGIASFVTTFAALMILAMPMILLVGIVSREALQLTEAVEPWVEEQTSEGAVFLSIPDWIPFSEQLQPYRRAIVERAGEALAQLGNFVVENLSRITQGTLAFLLYLFVMLYAIFFFLIRGASLVRLVSAHVPLDAAQQREIVEKGIVVTRATLKSMLVIGAVQGLLGGLAFAVVGIQGAVFWGLVMAFTSALPGIGAALIWAPAALILLIRADHGLALALALWGAVVVSGVDNILRPYLIGHDARMPDLLVLVSSLGGIAMFGIAGFIIGPVLAGVFMTSLSVFFATCADEPEADSAVRLIGLGHDSPSNGSEIGRIP